MMNEMDSQLYLFKDYLYVCIMPLRAIFSLDLGNKIWYHILMSDINPIKFLKTAWKYYYYINIIDNL